jgi:hypothetical protein
MASEFAKLNLAISTADLEQAWMDRLDDANSLEAACRYGAAMAARLYSLEMYLKMCICLRLNLANPIKKLEIHDLDALIIFAGFSKALGDMPPESNVKQNWDQILDFSRKLNDLRYLPAARWTEQQSRDLALWLNDTVDGVMTWLKTQK